MQETKKPYQSKTILINAALGLISVVAMFIPGAASLAEFIKAHSIEIGIGFSLLNVILRAVTKEKISIGE